MKRRWEGISMTTACLSFAIRIRAPVALRSGLDQDAGDQSALFRAHRFSEQVATADPDHFVRDGVTSLFS
jgi:hypothetical protein